MTERGVMASVSGGAAPRMTWQQATVVDITRETARAKTFRFALAQPPAHRAGQHFVLRLTAPDGYTRVAVVLDRVAARRLERRSSSPSSGSTTARCRRSCTTRSSSATSSRSAARSAAGSCGTATTPALLVGGGSGVVPLMAMLRLAPRPAVPTSSGSWCRSARRTTCTTPPRSRAPRRRSSTRARRRPDSPRPPARLARADIPVPIAPEATAYVCGSSGFADAASDVLMGAGIPAERIRVERFGPTG